jgi:hypothetical protein
MEAKVLINNMCCAGSLVVIATQSTQERNQGESAIIGRERVHCRHVLKRGRSGSHGDRFDIKEGMATDNPW